MSYVSGLTCSTPGWLPCDVLVWVFPEGSAIQNLAGKIAAVLKHAFSTIAGHGSQLPPLHEDGTALSLAAEKRAAIVMEGCAFSALAQTAVQGFAAGWEIPVTVLPADK